MDIEKIKFESVGENATENTQHQGYVNGWNDCIDAIGAEQDSFKNFHRLLCERFDYGHDPIDWRRDQLSLIEHIAKLRAEPAQQTPRITEQDGREKVLLEAVFKIEKKYFRTIHDHGATENAQIILAALRGMIGLPMILKRDLPEWDGVAYVMPPTSNLVANQPALLKKLNNNPATQEEK